ncbi:MAG: DUF3806 domain-containing protein [Paludibacterium sp.]|nr:DUF3806 domain-containing protein [Paludibacterium sp.]MBV8380815.1 DUF3806 domain-containing protein [Roseateles sp.]
MASANAQDQKIFPLTPDDLALQVRQRAVVEKFLSSEDLRERYPSPAGKLGALRALLKGKVFSATQTYELQAMGIVLGDVFVQDMGFKWVIVQDSVGRDFALQYKDSSVFLFPLTMISKRVEQGEDVDVFDLYNGIAAEASAQLQTAGYAKP